MRGLKFHRAFHSAVRNLNSHGTSYKRRRTVPKTSCTESVRGSHRPASALRKALACLSALCLSAGAVLAENSFTVVLDPGHGGKDPGAVGKLIYEKDIVLSVGKKVRQRLKDSGQDIRILMTRDNDTFVELERRAQMANKANADIFVSIHADAVDNRAVYGAGTFTMGMSKEQSNLEVAKRENGVMFLEENYQERYEGFDPKSVESYIIFELMQDVNMENSIRLASAIQDNLVAAHRLDRGVRQAPYWVLHRTSMPSVLVELGFITNAEEEKYMKSDKGQDQLADCLSRAILSYKRSIDSKRVSVKAMGEELKAGNPAATASQKDPASQKVPDDSGIIEYRIQLFAGKTLLPDGSAEFKGLNKVSHYRDGELYKYTYGSYGSEKEAINAKSELKSLFPDAFVVAFCDGSKLSLSEARKREAAR